MGRLDEDRNCWLATVRTDGRPHLAPVWFVHVEGALWIGTGAASVKVRNVRHEPRVSVCLEDGDAPVVAEGVAEVVAVPPPPAVVDAFAAKYRWDVTQVDDADVGALVMLRVDVTRWPMPPR